MNPLVYAEVSIRFSRIEDLEAAIPSDLYRRDPLPFEAAFLAGKAFLKYRKRGGGRSSPLPDFYIGAHAAVAAVAHARRHSIPQLLSDGGAHLAALVIAGLQVFCAGGAAAAGQ
jgi:predicted nucleic acid-binding protein